MGRGLGQGSWDGAWEFGLGDLISAEQRGACLPHSEHSASINITEQGFAPGYSPNTASCLASAPLRAAPGPALASTPLQPCGNHPAAWLVGAWPAPHPQGRVINVLALPTGPPQVHTASLSHQPPIPAALIPSLGTRALPPPHL